MATRTQLAITALGAFEDCWVFTGFCQMFLLTQHFMPYKMTSNLAAVGQTHSDTEPSGSAPPLVNVCFSPTLLWESRLQQDAKKTLAVEWMQRCLLTPGTPVGFSPPANSYRHRVVTLRPVAGGFDPQLDHTKDCKNGPGASLLGSQSPGLDLGSSCST